ncbi:MAG: hypothetical protein LBH32_08990 [Dysgonamonadaceae bacterium]|jgi:hypothetical protein|nr:hypothetical protein [Dysgonamonadaceae bacterium]
MNLSNIVEWIIAIALGIGGWYVAGRSSLSLQRKERYNNLVQDFHQFVSDFHLQVLPEMLKKNEDQYVVQKINNYLKFIYWKARDIDSFILKNDKKIYDKIKTAGEEFVDSALLDHDIETALIASKNSKKIIEYKNKFFQIANDFVEKCYGISNYR